MTNALNLQVLLRMLPNYYHHVQSYDNTLITKFFGLHRIIPSSGQKVSIVGSQAFLCPCSSSCLAYPINFPSKNRVISDMLYGPAIYFIFYVCETSWRGI